MTTPWDRAAQDELAEMRDDALTQPCTYCGQPVGERCWNKVSEAMLDKAPAHHVRLRAVGY